MRRVLLVGGGRDGERITMNDQEEYIRMVNKVAPAEFYRNPPTPEVAVCGVTTYKLERFQAGDAVQWVAYPVGTSPEHGLTMLMAGYVGNS